MNCPHSISSRPRIGKTIGDLLAEIAAEFANTEAVVSVFEKKRLTDAALLDEVNRWARAWMAAGIPKGQRVGGWPIHWVLCLVVPGAKAKIGVLQININPACRRCSACR